MNWRPSASIDILRKRALLMADIRDFFVQRGYLEVETPIMAHFGVSDVYLSNIKAVFRGKTYSLQTSPEYHMKRLLAAGSGPIFQLFRAFRDDELGRWHNPEFTLLEWYQLDVTHHGLMGEMDALLQRVLKCPPMVKKTYQEAFEEACGIDPHKAPLSVFKEVLKKHELDNVLNPEEEDRDQYLFLLMSHVVEPYYANSESPVALYDFPVSQAALAKVNKDVAERFEIYYRGVELANGFHELTDANAQSQRFQQDNQLRKEKGLPASEPDSFLLDALAHGLPPCSGVALGIDRLIAIALGLKSIAETLTFDISIA